MLTHEFKKSTFSPKDVFYCVICCKKDDKVMVAHSDNPEQSLSYSLYEWKAFIDGVKAGEFDINDIAL